MKQVCFETLQLKHVWEKINEPSEKGAGFSVGTAFLLFGRSLLYSTDFKTCLRFHRFSITSIMVHNEIPGSSKKKEIL